MKKLFGSMLLAGAVVVGAASFGAFAHDPGDPGIGSVELTAVADPGDPGIGDVDSTVVDPGDPGIG